MKRKILRLFLKLKNNYMYHLDTKIEIGFNITNLFCNIELFNTFFNFLFRILWVKKYLYCSKWSSRKKKLNDEARIICNLTFRNGIYYTTNVRNYFSKLILKKTIFYISRIFLACGFAKDLETSIRINIWYNVFYDGVSEQEMFYSYIKISLFGFCICLGR